MKIEKIINKDVVFVVPYQLNAVEIKEFENNYSLITRNSNNIIRQYSLKGYSPLSQVLLIKHEFLNKLLIKESCETILSLLYDIAERGIHNYTIFGCEIKDESHILLYRHFLKTEFICKNPKELIEILFGEDVINFHNIFINKNALKITNSHIEIDNLRSYIRVLDIGGVGPMDVAEFYIGNFNFDEFLNFLLENGIFVIERTLTGTKKCMFDEYFEKFSKKFPERILLWEIDKKISWEGTDEWYKKWNNRKKW